ncbi:MAG: histidinol-phosphatase [Bacilli bacterium]|nr:histidinol-phosphatase [Bacilli bacterium]
MRTNYHTHTYRCHHAGGTEEDYIIEAIEKNLKVLGFSDHGPFYDNRYGLRMDYCDLKEHIDLLKHLREKYKEKINIKIGLEIEYDPREDDFYKKLYEEYNLDYLILGQHFFMSRNGEMKNIYEIKDTLDFIDYANSVVSAMDSGFFKIIAHPDIFFVNDFLWDENCEKACDIIINAALERDFLLEFNANGLRRGISGFKDGKRYPYPHPKFFEKLSKTNVGVVINSDCHDPKQLWDNYMDLAHKMCENLKLNVIEKIF